MPKRIVPLSEHAVSKAKPQAKELKLFDGGGLFLLIPEQKFDTEKKPLPASKLWRLKYRLGGKEKRLSFGSYPQISLSAARKLREDARTLVSNGVDPCEVKKAQKAAKVTGCENSFEVVAREWYLSLLERKGCGKSFEKLHKDDCACQACGSAEGIFGIFICRNVMSTRIKRGVKNLMTSASSII